MNIVIIDTCIFINKEQDFFFDTPLLSLLKETKDVKIIMPVVIIEEITKKVEEIIDSTNKTVNEKNKKLAKYKIEESYKLTNLDKNTVIKDFKNKLLKFYKENNIDIEDYPKELTVHDVLNRALSRKKPFKKDGGDAGFKDFLIWLTVIEIAKKYPKDTINFITANKKDFTNDKNLHEDLIEDLLNLDIKNINNNVFQTLEEFKNAVFDLKNTDKKDLETQNNQSEERVEPVNVNESRVSDVINEIIDGNVEIIGIGETTLAEYLEKNYERISDILNITSDIFGYEVQFENIEEPCLANNSIRFNNMNEDETYMEFQVICNAEASIGGSWDGEFVGSCKLKISLELFYDPIENTVTNILIDDANVIDGFPDDALYEAENAFHLRFVKD